MLEWFSFLPTIGIKDNYGSRYFAAFAGTPLNDFLTVLVVGGVLCTTVCALEGVEYSHSANIDFACACARPEPHEALLITEPAVFPASMGGRRPLQAWCEP